MPSHKAADRIRNVALIGHRGSGKTSLHEALLYEAGAVNRLGTVESGSTVSDHAEDENLRRMSIDVTLACFEHDGREINLLDTPGEPSFVADSIASLRVADSAVVVVNGVNGVEVSTERLWRRADREGLARLVFVNMLDRERADFFAAIDSLKSAFGPHVVATEIPIGAEQDLRGVVDLIDMKAFVYEGEGRGRAAEVEIPEELRERAEEYREKLMDEVAEVSDELMERYLDGEEIDHEEIVTALKRGVTEGQIFPVTCGAATRNLGTDRLLAALVEDLPSPAMRGALHGLGEGEEEVEIAPEDGEGLIAYVFKTLADPYAGRINLFRVFRGTIRSDSQVLNAGRRQKERIGQLGRLLGKDLLPVDELGAGDIGAIAKLKETRAGDVLCERQEDVHFAPLELPSPVMAFAYETRAKGEEDKAASAVRRLTEEDPTLDVHRDPQTGEQIIAGLTQVHVEVTVERMKSRFGVEIDLHPPRVPYRESIRQPGGRPRPLQEAVRRPRPVRRLQDRDRARRGRRRPRLRQQDQGSGDPGRLHPGGRERRGGSDGARHRRRLPGEGRAGAAGRRQAPRRRLLRDGLQARRLDGLQAGDGGRRPGPARADRAAHRQLSRRDRRRRDRRPQLAPRPPAGDGAEGRGDGGQGRGADGRGARLRARTCARSATAAPTSRWSSSATTRSPRTSRRGWSPRPRAAPRSAPRRPVATLAG